jgi:tRNA nucleotidyltransferase (CCA-adding enzyme)
MDLITTHVNVDFDGLGSLVAAKKLYPDSRLLLPGSPERAVRDFLSLAKDIIKFETEKDFRPEGIDRLVIVDTRHRSRIGLAGQLIDKGVEVHIYDHHPRMKGDIVADKEVFLEVGATVTILADLLKKRGIKPSYLEATIMLLAIYEETGSLTYRSTTRMDVDMVSFLLSCGANLGVVSSYLNRALTEEELSFFTRLINATERMVIKGVTVSLIEIQSGDFSGEIGMLIHKLMEIESIPVLFVFVKTPGGRVNLIARSTLEGIDVNKVLSHFGGGGHPTAAYARIRDADIAELKARLVRRLESSIKVRTHAKDIMRVNPYTIDANESVSRAKALLMRRGLEGALVTDGRRILGVATLDRFTNAIRKGFGHSRVKGYMSTKLTSVGLEAPLYEVKRLILEKEHALSL